MSSVDAFSYLGMMAASFMYFAASLYRIWKGDTPGFERAITLALVLGLVAKTYLS